MEMKPPWMWSVSARTPTVNVTRANRAVVGIMMLALWLVVEIVYDRE